MSKLVRCLVQEYHISYEALLDHTNLPEHVQDTSANLTCLETVMLRMMNETYASFKFRSQHWSSEAVDFLDEIRSATPNELYDVGKSRSLP